MQLDSSSRTWRLPPTPQLVSPAWNPLGSWRARNLNHWLLLHATKRPVLGSCWKRCRHKVQAGILPAASLTPGRIPRGPCCRVRMVPPLSIQGRMVRTFHSKATRERWDQRQELRNNLHRWPRKLINKRTKKTAAQSQGNETRSKQKHFQNEKGRSRKRDGAERMEG